jgi:hypothetical protein
MRTQTPRSAPTARPTPAAGSATRARPPHHRSHEPGPLQPSKPPCPIFAAIFAWIAYLRANRWISARKRRLSPCLARVARADPPGSARSVAPSLRIIGADPQVVCHRGASVCKAAGVVRVAAQYGPSGSFPLSRRKLAPSRPTLPPPAATARDCGRPVFQFFPDPRHCPHYLAWRAASPPCPRTTPPADKRRNRCCGVRNRRHGPKFSGPRKEIADRLCRQGDRRLRHGLRTPYDYRSGCISATCPTTASKRDVPVASIKGNRSRCHTSDPQQQIIQWRPASWRPAAIPSYNNMLN